MNDLIGTTRPSMAETMPVPALSRALTDQAHLLEGLNEAIAILHDRLQPVLGPDIPDKASGSPEMVDRPLISHAIQRHNQKIESAIHFIQNLSNRLEI